MDGGERARGFAAVVAVAVVFLVAGGLPANGASPEHRLRPLPEPSDPQPDAGNAPRIERLIADPATSSPDLGVLFTAVVSDVELDVLNYRWDFGDGSWNVGRTGAGGGTIVAGHAYMAVGSFRPRLTVSDGFRSTSITITETVVAPALLRARTNLDTHPGSGVPGKILVDGIPRDEWSLSWVKLPPGPHTVSFTDVTNLESPADATVIAESGSVATVEGRYRSMGWLRVTTDPAVPGTISIDGVPRDDWGVWMAMSPGTYVVSFGPVKDYRPPEARTVTVVAETLTAVVGTYVWDGASPGPDPAGYGLLRVTTRLSDGTVGVNTRIGVDGVVRDEWSLSWVKLPPGPHVICFSDVWNLGTPGCLTAMIEAGQTTVLEGAFDVHGWLRVTTDPAVPGTVYVDGVPHNDWGTWESMPPGTYRVSFGTVPGFTTPVPRDMTVAPGELTHVVGRYGREVVTGFDWPVALVAASDGRLFVAERFTGRIRIFQDGAVLPEAFFELPGTATAGEQGLLGLALHPAFPTVPWLYAYHTYRDASAGSTYNRIVRIRATGNVGTSMEIVLAPIPAATYHNGGVIAFGPDGKLYAAIGDAQDSAKAQDLTVLHGKVLRMNDDGSPPPDNPFVGWPLVQPLVYTYGHRNLFGLGFHPVTGRAFVTENGPTDSDEVNLLVAGGNYGWPNVRGIANTPGYIDPIAVYTPVVAPTNLAFLDGDLVFGTWNTAEVRRLLLARPGYDRAIGDDILLTFPEGVLDLEADPGGSVWVSTMSAVSTWPVGP